MSAPDAERDLVKRSSRGDVQAFGAIVREHHTHVRMYVGWQLGRADMVDDVAQDVFVDAYRALATFRGEASLRTWLLGIARHRVLRHLRDRNRDTRFAVRLADEMIERATNDDQSRASEQTMAALVLCVQRLPERSAQLVTEHYFEGRSLVDLARVRGQKDGALRVALLRIRQALRACVEGRLAAQGDT